MKHIKYLLPIALLGLSMASCHDDDETYGVLDGLGVVKRFQTIEDGSRINARTTNQVTLSYNNLITINSGSQITLNGKAVNAKVEGMELIIDLPLEPWTEYTLEIPAGTIGRLDDTSITAEPLKINFNTNYGINPDKLDRKLVNPKATTEAVKLYDYLLSIYGQKQLSGAMGDIGWGTGYSELINQTIGQYPVVVGFDYLHLPASPSDWIDYGDISPVLDVWYNGGIPEINWHWNVPSSQAVGASPVEVWSGEVVMPGDWSGNLQLTDDKAKELWNTAAVGDYIVVSVKDVNTGANAQGSFKNSSWTEIAPGTEYFNITGDFELRIDNDILESLKEGGLIISGHDYTATKVTLYTGGKEQGEYSFNAENNSFKPSNVYKEGTWENAVAKADIAKIAGYLKLLQDENIPVLWRPFHEAAGDYTYGAWFWWGAEGVEVTKQLYKYLYEQLTNVYGLNNLIWVWTMQTSDGGALADISKLQEAYPGDEYVDIVGTDVYSPDMLSDQNTQFDLLNNAVGTRKMVALTECGNLVSPEIAANNDMLWLYFMQWYDQQDGNFGFYNYNSSQWIDILNSEYVLFRSDLPSLQ